MPPPRPSLHELLLVAAGGAAGGTARAALTAPATATGLPWGLLAVNTAGSLLLGVLLASGVRRSWRLLAGTGFCGAFTTMSGLAVAVDGLARVGRPGAGAAVLAASVVLGLAAVAAGAAVGRRLPW